MSYSELDARLIDLILSAAAITASPSLLASNFAPAARRHNGSRVTSIALREHDEGRKDKTDIDQAVKSREARVAILVGDSLRNALDMLDEQPATVLDALVERAKDLHLSGNAPKHRYKLRAALIDYLEERLHEARARERQLAQAITGTDLPTD